MRSLPILILSTGDPREPATTRFRATHIDLDPGSTLPLAGRVDTIIGG